ncbi:MAG: helix-turn-helix domain-containing protein [Agathobacter sp.]|nr:helix-turn-helix domain-containing protein [Agathobacter sp.]
MEYSLLINKVSKRISIHGDYGTSSESIDLTDIRIITKNQFRFKESTLYLSSTDRLPAPSLDQPFTIFCYGEQIDFSTYAQAAFRVIYFGEDISQAELFNIAIESMTVQPQLSIAIHTLMNVIFEVKGLQQLVDTASALVGNPIYVIDLQYKYLAISSGVFTENTFWSKESASAYVTEEGIEYIRNNHIDEKVRSSKLPIYNFNHMAGFGTLTSAIHIDGIEVGHIMIQESEHKFKDTDGEFLFNLARLVSMELQKNSVFTNNKGVMYSYLLAELLKPNNNNVRIVQQRLDSLGYKLKDDLYILVIPPSSYTNSNLHLEVILQSIRNIFVGSLYVIYENSIVFLVSKDKYQGFGEYEMERFLDFLLANNLKVGISNFFSDLEDAPRFLRQAVEALSLGIKLHPEQSIYHYEDYFIYQMLQVFEKEDKELRYLIHPGVMQLYYYDKEKGTDFIPTLRAYIEHPTSSSEVAQILHIHKNTFLYRMGKIKEITHCDFLNGDDYLTFNLSFKIMDYLHMI